MTKVILIVIIIILITVTCIGTLIITGIAGAGYFLWSKKPVVPTPQATVYEITSTVNPELIETTPLAEITPEATELPEIAQETQEQVSYDSKLKAIYTGSGDPQFPAGVRLTYGENDSTYKDFYSGEPYEFAKKLFKNSTWEIYEDGTFKFLPGSRMPRKNYYPLKGTATVAWNMVGLTNYSMEGPAGDDKNRFEIAGNINLDRSKPQLQLVFTYKFYPDKDINFGVKNGKVNLMTTVMQDVTKK
jgi:hypothetical protein